VQKKGKNMKKSILALAFILATSVSASAQNFYAGVNAGGVVTDQYNFDAPWSFGAVLGWNLYKVGPFATAIEGTFDYDKNKTKTSVINIVPSFALGPVTPYVLGGVGYRMSVLNDEAVYNWGGGIKYNLTKNFEVDARWRRIDNFDNNSKDDRATLGVNYKF
jgi:opacity protein-like surface antigen